MKENQKYIFNKNKILLIIIIQFVFLCNTYSQVFVKLDATGANDGTSWENAYIDLGYAIENSENGEIWVAAGVYLPSTDLNGEIPSFEREKTFRLKESIAIYGGFLGYETELNQRNWIDNQTILSGDIGVPRDSTDNVIHVVSSEYSNLNTNTVLDGLIIKDGSGFSSSDGAGIFVKQAFGTAFILKNCLIENNYSYGDGGGLYIQNCDPIIENNIFRNNHSFRGGAIYIWYSDATIFSNTITNNIADEYDGHYSTAMHGGGIYVGSYSSPVISQNIIAENRAGHEGGGIIIDNNYHTIFESNLVISNTSENGGGLFLDFSASYFFNNIFAKNSASKSGGGIYMDYTPGGPVFINNVITENSSSQGGSGLYLAGSNADIVNSIVYDNNPVGSQITAYSIYGDWSPDFRFCDIQGGEQSINSTGNPIVYEYNYDVDPMFLNINEDNYRLNSQSALINAGTSSTEIISSPWTGSNGEMIYFPTTDFDGDDRIVEIIDIGAYEFNWSIHINEEISNNYFIYPNPTTGIINYDFTNIDVHEITISSIAGKVIFESTLRKEKGMINISNFETGIYVLSIKTEQEKFTTKIIKR